MERWHVKMWASAPGANPERVLVDVMHRVRGDTHAKITALIWAAARFEPPFKIVSLVRVDPPADHPS